jgi:hypothetical protein
MIAGQRSGLGVMFWANDADFSFFPWVVWFGLELWITFMWFFLMDDKIPLGRFLK